MAKKAKKGKLKGAALAKWKRQHPGLVKAWGKKKSRKKSSRRKKTSKRRVKRAAPKRKAAKRKTAKRRTRRVAVKRAPVRRAPKRRASKRRSKKGTRVITMASLGLTGVKAPKRARKAKMFAPGLSDLPARYRNL